MKGFTLVRLLLHASRAALPVVLIVASASTSLAQARTGAGMVVAVDVAENALVLETRSGLQRVLVDVAATIRGDHDEVLMLRDLDLGDAVYYQAASPVTALRVARQFWALPSER